MEIDSSVVPALARATVYRTFAVAFQPPTEAGLRSIGAGDGFRTLKLALQVVAPSSSRQVDAGIKQLRREGRRLMPLAAQYSRVFGHTARGLVCPCETEYGDDNKYQQPQQLADISGYYLAFGLTPIAGSELRQDHVACECEFMVFLNLKQALFAEEGAHGAEGVETLDVTRQAERTFLRDHLGRFGRAFASTLASNGSGAYYSTWGMLFLTWLELEHSRLGLEIASDALPLRTEFTDEAPMACGSASDLIQILRP